MSSYDPQVQLLLKAREAAGTPPLYTLSIERARADDLASIQANSDVPAPVASVRDLRVPGPGGDIPIRVYRPEGSGPFPVLVYLFGGGWVLGTIDTADAICRDITNGAGCVVVSVGYRLAPEHPFPAAVEDCAAAVTWVSEHADEFEGDPARLAVAGDSAGGNLAAAVTLLARDHGGPPIVFQLLVYPVTQHLSDTESMREGTDPLLFNNRSVRWYWDHYLTSPEDGRNPLASPLLAADLGGLPPALVITAEFDPLRDEAEQYANRMADAGVDVELVRYPGMVHGFFAMTGALDAARTAMEFATRRLRSAFGLPVS
jgi:acetyl esterase